MKTNKKIEVVNYYGHYYEKLAVNQQEIELKLVGDISSGYLEFKIQNEAANKNIMYAYVNATIYAKNVSSAAWTQLSLHFWGKMANKPDTEGGIRGLDIPVTRNPASSTLTNKSVLGYGKSDIQINDIVSVAILGAYPMIFDPVGMGQDAMIVFKPLQTSTGTEYVKVVFDVVEIRPLLAEEIEELGG